MSNAAALYVQCKTLLDALIKDDESKGFFGPMLEMANSALDREDHVFLQRLVRELLMLSRDFPDRVTPEMLQELGVLSPDIREKVARILKRGKIASATDFRLVNEYIDQIYQNPEMLPVVEQLGKMLLSFEQGKGDTEQH